MELLRDYPENVLLGVNLWGQEIYLRRPSWDCDWYWGFGYVGNADTHYHLDGLGNVDIGVARLNLYDQLLTHFGEDVGAVGEMKKRNTLWTFCDVVQTVYALRKTAEVLGRGCSNYGTNPVTELIKNPAEVERINNVLIPRLIDEMYVALGCVEPMEKEDVK